MAEHLRTDSHRHSWDAPRDADPAVWRTDLAVADLVRAIARRSPAGRRAAVGQLAALGFADEEIQRHDAAAEALLHATAAELCEENCRVYGALDGEAKRRSDNRDA